MEGHIFTEGVIGKGYADSIADQLANVGTAETIIHHIKSEGGDVYEGYDAYHTLRQSGKKIVSVVEGKCMSIATLVALAGDEVVILNPSRWMIHNPSLMMGGRGNADMLQAGADDLRKIQTEMAEVYSKKTGMPIDQVKTLMQKETNYTAKEAVGSKFADRVIEIGELLPNNERAKYKAVALGEEIKNEIMEPQVKETAGVITKLGEILTNASKLFAPKAEPVTTPKAMDYPLKAGGVLQVQSETDEIMGMPATIDGAPAPDGSYELEDGRVIMVTGGVVTEVKEPAPAPSPEEQMKAKIAELEAQLAQKEAAQQAAAAIEEKAKLAEQEKEKVAVALAQASEELEKLKKQTIGNEEKDDIGMITHSKPFAIGGGTSDELLKIKATRTFIADNMPHLERYYKGGKYPDGTRFMDYRTNGPEAVSIVETNFSYTWNGVLTTDLFYTPSIGTPALSDLFTIDTGSKDKKRYNIVPSISNVQKPYTGCDQPVTGTTANITNKTIQLKPFQMYEGWCKDDFTDQLTGSFNYLAQEWLKSGNESFDPAGTPIDRMIMDLLKDALRRDTFRRASFGDISSSSANYNQIDGLVTTLIDQSGASNYCVYASKTNFGTGALSANAAVTEFAAMYNNSNVLLKEHVIDSGKGYIACTRSIWENYLATLRGYGAVTEQQFQNLQSKPGAVSFQGIPVIPVTAWDKFLAESTNPLYATTRHIAILGSTDNFILGVEDTVDLNSIDSWFEKKDNKRYYRHNCNYGVLAPLHCDLVTISY